MSGQSDILAHYATQDEAARLEQGSHRLEKARTQEIIERYLPSPPAVVLDVGGGPGVYARWLAARAYEVHLLDLSPQHIEQAVASSNRQAPHTLASAQVGDARTLPWPDGFADVVLLLGPLYHLTDRPARLAAIREAARVLRPGGIVLAAAISRFASLCDGLAKKLLADPQFASIVDTDLKNGQHRNPGNHPAYFTTAYFHRPEELAIEMTAGGLHHESTLGVEGPAWLLSDFDERWQDPMWREWFLESARRLEAELSVTGISAHLIAIGRRR